eukprot:GHVQ01018375.1.p1 GENE.GHVQ01018375.1~~GHVQ01018375.1.p1  ORF type:complete len:148 (-),score=34.10 GHVQ01018375.1:103-546(-)
MTASLSHTSSASPPTSPSLLSGSSTIASRSMTNSSSDPDCSDHFSYDYLCESLFRQVLQVLPSTPHDIQLALSLWVDTADSGHCHGAVGRGEMVGEVGSRTVRCTMGAAALEERKPGRGRRWDCVRVAVGGATWTTATTGRVWKERR